MAYSEIGNAVLATALSRPRKLSGRPPQLSIFRRGKMPKTTGNPPADIYKYIHIHPKTHPNNTSITIHIDRLSQPCSQFRQGRKPPPSSRAISWCGGVFDAIPDLGPRGLRRAGVGIGAGGVPAAAGRPASRLQSRPAAGPC